MAFELLLPNETIIGKGALEKALPFWKKMGKHVLIITDPTMVRLGNAEALQGLMEKEGIETEVYGKISGEPTDIMINAGLKIYKEKGCDSLIGFGGGSAIDSMKAVALLASNGGSIADYSKKAIRNPLPPMTAIPTTAGTGSEVTRYTVINDTSRQVKMLLTGQELIPDLAVIDPRFTMTLPPKVTASTGLDAFTHAVEAFTSRKANTMTDVFALSAFKRIVKNLPLAYKDGSNEEAREQMAVAAYEAGISINNSSVTVVHGMSRPIGALFHVPHGISNAMLDVKCFTYVLNGAKDRFAILAREAGAAEKTDDDDTAAEKFLELTKELCRICEVPTLEEYGIDKEKFFENMKKMTEDALTSGSPANTRMELHEADIMEIYKTLWDNE